MAIVKKEAGHVSHTSEDAKSRWATRWECFYDAQYLHGREFNVDVCAEPATAKVDRFYVSDVWWNSGIDRTRTPHIGATHNRIVGINALNFLWEDSWWCNPPFDMKREFIMQAIKSAQAGRSGMMLIPYEPCSTWFRELVKPHATTIYEPDGRYQFFEFDGVTKKSGANFACCLVSFTPAYNNGEARVIPFNRGIGL